MIKYLTINDIRSYEISSKLSDYIWEIIIKWDYFAKTTLGSQWVRSTDSISANIAEGFGRFHKKDKIKFYYNSRGSLLESIHWTSKAEKRNLITSSQNNYIMSILNLLPTEINLLRKSAIETSPTKHRPWLSGFDATGR